MNQYLFIATFEIKTNTWIWIILITSIFYYLMFKIKIYRHHYVSAILILLIGIIIDIVLENIKNDINKDLLLFLLKFIRQILFSLYNVMAKYIMEKKFISVYEFSTYIGVIVFVLLVIFFIFDYTIFDIFNYKEYFNNFNYIELLVILGVISTQFGINLCSLFTVRNNSPCHIFVMFVFGQIAYYINFE
jgi:drug/metabolite transporter (DMT)-like permease